MGIKSIVSSEVTMNEPLTGILPLYHFFDRLRQNEFPLGIGEYERLLTALSTNFGISVAGYKTILTSLNSNTALSDSNTAYPKSSLLRLCKLLWLKPGQSIRLFEDIFEETYLLDFKYLENTNSNTINKENEVKKTVDKHPFPKRNEKDQNHEGQDLALPAEKSSQDIPSGTIDNSPVTVRIALGENASNNFSLDQEKEIEKSKFLFTQNYFPIDNRKTQQNLRAFPAFRHVINSMEMDVDATINKMVEKGFFNEVVFKKQKKSISNLLLLIDHEGSMVAFNQLSKRILTEMEGALLPVKKIKNPTLQTFYFYNVWGNYLYKNKTHTQYIEFNKVTGFLKNKQANIIIISDAGAAKGTYNTSRINITTKLLLELKNCTSKIAWLNPMPAERWKNTSAEEISKTVTMFEANENGIKNAVNLMKGSNIKLVKL
ncbi:MAG: hypothetical protein ABIN67_09530 [Ferruginibacter sp.]